MKHGLKATRRFRGLRMFLVLVLVGLFGMTGAQSTDGEAFAKMVEENSKHCPYYLDGVTVNGITYDSSYLHFNFTMEDIYMFGRSVPEMKSYFANLLRYRYEPKREHDLYVKLAEIKGGLSYDLTLDSTRRSFSLQYTPEEFQQIWADREKPEYRDSLKWLARHYAFTELYLENHYSLTPRSDNQEPLNIDSANVTDETVTYYVSCSDADFPYVSEHRDVQKSFWDNRLLFDDSDNPWLPVCHHAGYEFRIVYENLSRTDSFHILYPDSELVEMIDRVNKFTLATDEQLETYLQTSANSKEWVSDLDEGSDLYNLFKVYETEYRNRTLFLTYLVSEGGNIFDLAPDDTLSLKQYLSTLLRSDLESEFETPDIISDTVLVTLEGIFQYLHGVKLLFIEENTRKALTLDILAEEIANAKLPAVAADQETEEKIMEQVLAEKFVRRLEKCNREECPIVSGIVIIDSLSYDYENLHYYGHIENLDAPVSDTAAVKNALLKQLQFAVNDGGFLFEYMMLLESGLTVHYFIPKADTTLLVHISYGELQEMVVDDSVSVRERARAALNELITAVNANAPYSASLFIRFESVYIEDAFLTYHYTILSPFDAFKKESASLDWTIRSNMSAAASKDADFLYLLSLCVKSGYGLCYRYTPPAKNKKKKFKKGEVIDVRLSIEDLQPYIQE